MPLEALIQGFLMRAGRVQIRSERLPFSCLLRACPVHGRDRIRRGADRPIVTFIDEAKHRLFVQNERFQDLVVIECLSE